jgi:hypothetical protein
MTNEVGSWPRIEREGVKLECWAHGEVRIGHIRQRQEGKRSWTVSKAGQLSQSDPKST